ncbi:lysophospholipid acyltransferase family protein [Candidatus Omnitrophota bacterium]
MWYWVFRSFFVLFYKTFFKFKVEGLDNLPHKTNFIIIANHGSWMDPVVLGVAVPRRINYIAMRALYSISWLRWYVKLMSALPTGTSSEKAIELLNKYKNVGLFPEGACTGDGSLRTFRRGAALLAIKTGRPVVPCAILGTYESYPRGRLFPKLFVPIKVIIGKPIYLLKEFHETIDDVCLQEGIFRVRNAVKQMLNV